MTQPDPTRKCPACGSTRIYQSRFRSMFEKARGVFTQKQPYRCHACNRRDWYPIALPHGQEVAPDDLRVRQRAHDLKADDFDQLDTR